MTKRTTTAIAVATSATGLVPAALIAQWRRQFARGSRRGAAPFAGNRG